MTPSIEHIDAVAVKVSIVDGTLPSDIPLPFNMKITIATKPKTWFDEGYEGEGGGYHPDLAKNSQNFLSGHQNIILPMKKKIRTVSPLSYLIIYR